MYFGKFSKFPVYHDRFSLAFFPVSLCSGDPIYIHGDCIPVAAMPCEMSRVPQKPIKLTRLAHFYGNRQTRDSRTLDAVSAEDIDPVLHLN